MSKISSAHAVDTFECEMCHRVFEKEWSDDEAVAESRAYFGELPEKELATICDDCWHRIKPKLDVITAK